MCLDLDYIGKKFVFEFKNIIIYYMGVLKFVCKIFYIFLIKKCMCIYVCCLFLNRDWF